MCSLSPICVLSYHLCLCICHLKSMWLKSLLHPQQTPECKPDLAYTVNESKHRHHFLRLELHNNTLYAWYTVFNIKFMPIYRQTNKYKQLSHRDIAFCMCSLSPICVLWYSLRYLLTVSTLKQLTILLSQLLPWVAFVFRFLGRFQMFSRLQL